MIPTAHIHWNTCRVDPLRTNSEIYIFNIFYNISYVHVNIQAVDCTFKNNFLRMSRSICILISIHLFCVWIFSLAHQESYANMAGFNGTLYVMICVPSELSMLNDPRNHFKLLDIKVKPVVDLAIEHVEQKQILPRGILNIVYKDTRLSDTYGPWLPVEVVFKCCTWFLKLKHCRHYFQAMLQGHLDCIMGYATNYEMAPVARSSWLYKNGSGVPLITTIGLVDLLWDKKNTYKLLTRMNGSYRLVARFVYDVFRKLKWLRFAYLFQNNAKFHAKFVGFLKLKYHIFSP